MGGIPKYPFTYRSFYFILKSVQSVFFGMHNSFDRTYSSGLESVVASGRRWSHLQKFHVMWERGRRCELLINRRLSARKIPFCVWGWEWVFWWCWLRVIQKKEGHFVVYALADFFFEMHQQSFSRCYLSLSGSWTCTLLIHERVRQFKSFSRTDWISFS